LQIARPASPGLGWSSISRRGASVNIQLLTALTVVAACLTPARAEGESLTVVLLGDTGLRMACAAISRKSREKVQFALGKI
jgi:hypothetical protein